MQLRNRLGFAAAAAGVCALLAGCPLLVFDNPPTARFSADAVEGYAPLTVKFSDESLPGTAPVTSWRWTIGITQVSTLPSFEYVFETPGTFSVTLEVTSAHGSDAAKKDAYITILAPQAPAAAFSADITEGFAPLTVQFTDESTPGTSPDDLSWLWNFGDGTTSEEQHPLHVFETCRKCTVSLTVATDHGKDTETKAEYINVLQFVPPAPDFSATPTSGRDPLVVKFTDLTEPGTGEQLTYAWDFGDGGTSSETEPVHTYVRLGTFDVSLTVTSEHGAATKSKPALVHLSNLFQDFGGGAADRAYALFATPGAGFVLAGETQSFGAGERDMYLIHAGPDGNLLWSRTFGGAGDDFANACTVLTDGGFVLAGGKTTGEGDLDLYVVRTDSSGNRVWDRTYGGEADDAAGALTATSDGGLFIAGTTQAEAGANPDLLLVRTDPEGGVVWSRVIGGDGLEQVNAAIETAGGGFALAGATTTDSMGARDALLLWIDASGSDFWTRTFGGTLDDTFRDLLQTENGGYLLTGGSGSFGEGLVDAYVVATDAAGGEIWSRTYGGPGIDQANAVIPASDGTYLIAGHTASFGAGAYDAFLLKTSLTGEPVWENLFLTFGAAGTESAYDVIETAAGGFAFAGETASSGDGGLDAYLVRTDETCQVVGFP
ncbi:MAG: PKD domain-containing protein [Candidatus Hydrogenedentes bacterium]|nr:PKD domain-containing protein [Candidatus Hydrogenedentota bacterium]